MRRFRLYVVLLVLSLVAAQGPVTPAAPDKPAIEGLAARFDDDRLLVSFRLVNGLSGETLERIHSGIPVGFRYRIEVVRRRFLFWPAKELAKAWVDVEASYNSLTQQYSLKRSLQLVASKKRDTPEPEVEELSTTSAEEMRAWMTELHDVAVYNPTRAIEGEALKLRVESNLGRRYVWLVIPSSIGASAELRLER
jgi:hypothetical protein